MSLVHAHNFRKSVRYAARGLAYVFRHERNFQIHIAIAAAAVILGIGLRISVTQWLFVLSAIGSVLALEMVNTIFEKFVDLFQPRIHHYAEVIKDLMAGAVLLAATTSFLIGVIIFIPALLTRFT